MKDLTELARECWYHDTDYVTAEEPMDFLICTLEPEKNPCPDTSGLCCAQCHLIDTCAQLCPFIDVTKGAEARLEALRWRIATSLVQNCEYYDEDSEHFGGDEAPRPIWLCSHPRSKACPEKYEDACCGQCLEDCDQRCPQFEEMRRL